MSGELGLWWRIEENVSECSDGQCRNPPGTALIDLGHLALDSTPVFLQDGSYSFCATPGPGEESDAAEWGRSQDTRIQNQLPCPHQHPEGRRTEGHLHWVLGAYHEMRDRVWLAAPDLGLMH